MKCIHSKRAVYTVRARVSGGGPTHVLLGHYRGWSLGQLAHFFAVRYATALAWVQAWPRGCAVADHPGRSPS